MPCDGVAVVRANVSVSLSEMLKVPGCVDALTALLNQSLQVASISVSSYGIEINLANGEYVSIDMSGRLYGSSQRTQATVKQYLEELSLFMVVQVAAAKVREVARVKNETYVDGGALVLSVEI